MAEDTLTNLELLLHYDGKQMLQFHTVLKSDTHFGPLTLVTTKEALPSVFTGCDVTSVVT